jgi:hypothetical protein
VVGRPPAPSGCSAREALPCPRARHCSSRMHTHRARARALVAVRVGKGLWWTDGRPLLPLVRWREPLAALLRGRKPPFRGAHGSLCSLCAWHAVRPRLGGIRASS